MNVSFTKKQEEYIANQVATGDYENNSEVIRDASRLQGIYKDKVINDLREAINKGWDSANSSRTVQDIIDAKNRKS